MVWRLAWPLGRQYPRRRRDELQSEDRFSGLARELALGRALDAHRPTTLEYVVTIEDPTVWTRPWTVKQDFTKQNDAENRIYYEPRCIEGNYALPGWLRRRRMEELAFAEGRGPDPATRDSVKGLEGTAVDQDPLR